MKQKTNIILKTTVLFITIGIGYFLSTLSNQPSASSPTPPKSEQQSTGASASSSTNSEAAKSTSQSSAPSRSATQFASTQPSPPTPQLSPKHTAIKQVTAKEYLYRIFATPNDPRHNSDWPLQKVAAPTAWDQTTGNGQTIVAVIDSGFALAHEDLVDQWHTNPNEVGQTQSGDGCWTGVAANKQTNSCDDDNNGYIDDWRGWNFALEDNNPQTGRTNPHGDGVRHATEVAGLVGATGNNGRGSTAINWNTNIMPLQALDDNGLGYTSDVVAAMYYAVDNGAQVINLSLGTYGADPYILQAVNYATANNVVVVAASGNCGNGGADCQGVSATSVAYPAAYPDVIGVGATTQGDARADFSSYGPGIDVVAPGANLPTSPTWTPSNQTTLYASSLYGTSFATPQVSSLASLIRSIRPSSTVQDISAIVTGTTFKPTTMNGMLYSWSLGHGIINANAALQFANTLNTTTNTTLLLHQAGSFQAERITSSNTTLGSGCGGASGSACTIQFTSRTSGHKRYLPYLVLPESGETGWIWATDTIEHDDWEIRALSGELLSTTPYLLLKTNL